MAQSAKQFGLAVSGALYVDRPGAYGIAFNGEGSILVVTVDETYTLPGGGLEPSETPEEGLMREFLEETGYRIRILRPLGTARQYVFAQAERIYFNKLCHFFQVALIGDRGAVQETDHHAQWLHCDQAVDALKEEAHGWAVAKLQGLSGCWERS